MAWPSLHTRVNVHNLAQPASFFSLRARQLQFCAHNLHAHAGRTPAVQQPNESHQYLTCRHVRTQLPPVVHALTFAGKPSSWLQRLRCCGASATHFPSWAGRWCSTWASRCVMGEGCALAYSSDSARCFACMQTCVSLTAADVAEHCCSVLAAPDAATHRLSLDACDALTLALLIPSTYPRRSSTCI